MPTIINGPFDEVGLSRAITEAIKTGGKIEAVPSYSGWANSMLIRDNPSDNHWSLGFTADLVNLSHGYKPVLTQEQLFEKLEHHVTGTVIDLRELFERGAYFDWNFDTYRTAREIVSKINPRLSNMCHVHLRAIASALALSSYWVDAKSMSVEELLHYGPNKSNPHRSGILTATAPSLNTVFLPPAVPDGIRIQVHSDYRNLPSSACCGVRGWNTKQKNTAGKAPDLKKHGPPAARDLPGDLFGNIIKDILEGRLDKRGQALQDSGHNGHWLPDDERVVLMKVTQDDPDSIDQAIEWYKQGIPYWPFRIIRTEHYVIMVCLEAPSAPTATLYFTVVEKSTGKHWFGVCDPGDRHDIKHGKSTVVIDNGPTGVKITLNAVRDDGLESGPLTLTTGPIIVDVEASGKYNTWKVTKGWDTQTEPDSNPDPKPKPKDSMSILQKLIDWIKERLGIK